MSCCCGFYCFQTIYPLFILWMRLEGGGITDSLVWSFFGKVINVWSLNRMKWILCLFHYFNAQKYPSTGNLKRSCTENFPLVLRKCPGWSVFLVKLQANGVQLQAVGMQLYYSSTLPRSFSLECSGILGTSVFSSFVTEVLITSPLTYRANPRTWKT